jgi:hypothetical protein
MARGALWTGNSSFTDFSVRTMNATLALLAVALFLYLRYAVRARVRRAAFLGLPVVVFCAAMVYVTGSSYAYTKGFATAASPWYLQAVMPALLCMAVSGCQYAARTGPWIAGAMAALWAYVLAAAYLAKLIPLYGGFARGRSTLRDIVAWYASSWRTAADILNTTALAPCAVITLLLLLLLAVLLALAPALVRQVWREFRKTPARHPLPGY